MTARRSKVLASLFASVWTVACSAALCACTCDDEVQNGATYNHAVPFPPSDSEVTIEACWNGRLCANGIAELTNPPSEGSLIGCELQGGQRKPDCYVYHEDAAWRVNIAWFLPHDWLEDGDVYEVHIGTESAPDLVDLKKKVTYREYGGCADGLFADL